MLSTECVSSEAQTSSKLKVEFPVIILPPVDTKQTTEILQCRLTEQYYQMIALTLFLNAKENATGNPPSAEVNG